MTLTGKEYTLNVSTVEATYNIRAIVLQLLSLICPGEAFSQEATILAFQSKSCFMILDWGHTSIRILISVQSWILCQRI